MRRLLIVRQRFVERALSLALAAFLLPNVLLAQGTGGGGIANPLKGACDEIGPCVENVVRYALGLAGILALAGIIYGGFLYMTAGDSQDRIQSGKQAVFYSIFGLIVIGLAYAIVNFIFQALGGGGGPGGFPSGGQPGGFPSGGRPD